MGIGGYVVDELVGALQCARRFGVGAGNGLVIGTQEVLCRRHMT